MRKRIPKGGPARTCSEMLSGSESSPCRVESRDYLSEESKPGEHRVYCNESIGSSTVVNGIGSKENDLSFRFSFPKSNQSDVLTEGPIPVNSGKATPMTYKQTQIMQKRATLKSLLQTKTKYCNHSERQGVGSETRSTFTRFSYPKAPRKQNNVNAKKQKQKTNLRTALKQVEHNIKDQFSSKSVIEKQSQLRQFCTHRQSLEPATLGVSRASYIRSQQSQSSTSPIRKVPSQSRLGKQSTVQELYLKRSPLGKHMQQQRGPLTTVSPKSNSQKSQLSLSAVLNKDMTPGSKFKHHRGPGPNPDSHKPTISVTMSTPKVQEGQVQYQEQQIYGKPLSMHQLLADRKAALHQQSQPSKTLNDQIGVKTVKGHKRRQISDGDANLLRPLKRFLVYKKTGNRKSLISPEKQAPDILHSHNMSFQSIYEQLNNTRLLSNKSSLNSSPYGKPQQFIAKEAKESQIKNIQKIYELTGEQTLAQQADNSIQTLETATPKTKLKNTQNDKNSNKNNMMSQSQSMVAHNSKFRRTNTGSGVKDIGSPATGSIYLCNSPLKPQTKSSSRVSQLHNSGAIKSPYNSQMLLTKNNSTLASNQTMSLAYRSNTSKSKMINPLSDSLHSSMHQLPSQHSQPQLYQPKYNKPKISDMGSTKAADGLTSPFTEKYGKHSGEQSDSKPMSQLPTANYNQSTSRSLQGSVFDQPVPQIYKPLNSGRALQTTLSSAVHGIQPITQSSSNNQVRQNHVGLLRQSQYGTPNRNEMQIHTGEKRLNWQDNQQEIVSNQEFEPVVTQESNQLVKQLSRDEGMPMFQKQHNTRQAVQNDGVQSFLTHEESTASLIMNGNRDRQGNFREEKKYHILESNSSNEQTTTRRQKLSDRFSPVQKSPRVQPPEGMTVLQQKMYPNTNQSPRTKQQTGTMLKQLTNAPSKSHLMKPQMSHKQAPPVNQKTLRQSNLTSETGYPLTNADRIVKENLKQDNVPAHIEQPYKSYIKKDKELQLHKLNPVMTPGSSLLESESFTDMKNSNRTTIVQVDLREAQQQSSSELNTQEAEVDVRVQVEDLYDYNHSKRLTIKADQQDFVSMADTEPENPFNMAQHSQNELLVDTTSKPMRKSSPHRVYTYTYNESPMSKELERGQIKNTVVRQTRLWEGRVQNQNDSICQPVSIISRNSNPASPQSPQQLNSSLSRLSMTQKHRPQLGAGHEQRQIGSFPLSANIKNFIRQSSPQFSNAKKIMHGMPLRKLRSGEGPQESTAHEASQEGSDGSNNQQKGMFNNFMKTIGTMFASSPHQQNEVQMQELHKQYSESFDRPENLQPSAAEISVNLEDDINDSDVTPAPMRRGRVCDCPKDHDFPMVCSKARLWYERTSNRSMPLSHNTYQKLKETYKSLHQIKADEESIAQIERDLGRTFPRHPYFMEELGGKGHEKLRRVLIAFSNYDCQVDYVQGMNFIVAQLLIHCSETFAFWLFVALIEDCEMRDIYLPKLPGLFKHSQMIELLIKVNLPKLQCHLIEHNIRAQMYASEWVFGLFASVIPCEHMCLFLDKFFQHKWIFFYSLILTILRKHEDQILNEEDFYCILHQIKAQQHKASGIGNLKTSKTIVTQAEKERLQNEDHSLGDLNTDDSGLNETTDEAEPKSMFNVFKKFISTNLGFTEDVGVTSSNFWPMIIERAQSEFPSLYRQQNGINRLLHEFDPEHMQFIEAIPDDPWHINEILNR